MSKKRKILLAEDTHVSAVMMVAALESAGHQVRIAVDGKQACELAERTNFDVILMDVNMPKLDGMAATRRIRTHAGPNASTPIIGLTGEDDATVQRAPLEVGMDGYLIKPMPKEQLIRAIERAIYAFEKQQRTA